MSPPSRLPCPCCRQLTVRERGRFEVCPVCAWEGDGQDEADADAVRGGPNGELSLTQARHNFAAFGACAVEHLPMTRPPLPDEIPFPPAILALENESRGPGGRPTLARAYELLLAEWRRGNVDREIGLHLMFLAWYLLCEPPQLTGLHETCTPPADPATVWHEVHTKFAGRIRRDAEMAYAIGLMAHLFPYLLGDEADLRELSREYRALYRSLAPDGASTSWFAERGAYGEYFRHQTSADGGF